MHAPHAHELALSPLRVGMHTDDVPAAPTYTHVRVPHAQTNIRTRSTHNSTERLGTNCAHHVLSFAELILLMSSSSL